MKFKLLAVVLMITWVASAEVSVVGPDLIKGPGGHYVNNRAPLEPLTFIPLPPGAVKPAGWLGKKIRLQADGFHGHLTEISRFLKKEKNAWLSQTGEGEYGWEEVPYWLKGFSNAAWVLNDESMKKEAMIWIEGALDSQQPDGWFGPDKGRTGLATNLKGREDLWPNAIMLFCLQDYYDFSGDSRVIELMKKYFDYLKALPEEQFLVGYWPSNRGGDLLYSVIWLYNRIGDESLLPLCHKIHRRSVDWVNGIPNWHNVNMSQSFGEPGTYYLVSHEKDHLFAADRNYREIRTLYGQVPGGMFGADENCRKGYGDPRQAVETCGMVEMMLSCEMLLRICGEGSWADRCEDVAFNSLPAALTADMKALRYLTAPNMVKGDKGSKSPGIQNGGPMFHMDPHDHRCCQHNFGHGWPYYAQSLWAATPDKGLAALFYNASTVAAKIGDGRTVTIQQKTHYPFDETIQLTIIDLKGSHPFPIYLRVPQWCQAPVLKINGKNQDLPANPTGYIKIARNWKQSDTVELKLPMELAIRTWADNHNSVSVDRGPLTYSLKIREDYVNSGGTELWPSWEIYPESPWNYGLILNPDKPTASFKVIRKDWPGNDMPFTHDGCPIELIATGQRIPQWHEDPLGLVGLLQDSPVKSDEPIELIRLIPMGAARLRIASFPVIGKGAEAKEWTASPRPMAWRATASHCYANDSVNAMKDGLIPANSNDQSIPRMTFWPKKGTTEWVQYDLGDEKAISSVSVYWFDDRPAGGCAVPATWKVLYQKGDQWQEVSNPTVYARRKDIFNKVKFDAIKTTALRLEIELQKELSGGILEWTIE